MSLTLLYGTINLVSSYLGTSLVHCLQDSTAVLSRSKKLRDRLDNLAASR